jgi:hypothetical protein
MGSSLRVNPAADMCAHSKGNLVIVNLQTTPLDHLAFMCIHAKIDDVMDMLMKELNIQIPQFTLKRWAECSVSKGKTGKETVSVRGITETGGHYDIFKNISVNGRVGAKVDLTE